MAEEENSPLLQPLKGADSPDNYIGSIRGVETSEKVFAVVPILTGRSRPSADFKFLGCGFFIAQGIVATARHVIEEFGSGAQPFVFQYDGENAISPRRVHESSIDRDSDVGILRVLVEHEGQRNRSVVLSSRKPNVGDLVFTQACANSKVWPVGDKQSIAMNFEFFRGSLIQSFPNGRDRTMLPWPCYQVDYHLHAGASGAPTFHKEGSVFAINCMSHHPDTNTAYVNSVDMLLGCPLNDIVINDKSYKTATVADLVDGGIVKYSSS